MFCCSSAGISSLAHDCTCMYVKMDTSEWTATTSVKAHPALPIPCLVHWELQHRPLVLAVKPCALSTRPCITPTGGPLPPDLLPAAQQQAGCGRLLVEAGSCVCLQC